ncbi:hypothetical protein BD408DRAFT_419374 [Parasitella parasitica]|nr:hypothetical protein BD408DRAFT_419374 [Parasitella parasitica]
MKFFTKRTHHYNRRFLSPPMTPTQHAESCFVKLTLMDHYNAATLPPSPPACSISSLSDTGRYRRCQRESSFDSFCSSSHSGTLSQTKRKQANPSRSPPSTTKGTFLMPFDLLTKMLNTVPYHENNAATAAKSSEQRKRKRGNDCITHVEELESEEEQEKEKRHKNSSPLPPSSIMPPSLQPSPNALTEQVEIIKKSGTSAAYTYDNLSADCDQATLFLGSEEWIPSLEAFNRKPTIRISWKGPPLKIKTMPYFVKLHPGEAAIAATLRLTPEQYLKCKWALILAAKEANVNKTSVLWNTFGKLGWLGPRWPQ